MYGAREHIFSDIYFLAVKTRLDYRFKHIDLK